MELRRSMRPACRCLQARWLRLVQRAGPTLSGADRLRALHLNVSRDLAHDLLLSFSPDQDPMTISSMEEGTAGKIRLPREVFQSLGSQAARVVVTVLNIQQLGMFKV
ncbi:Adhesion G protein-coupled receptor G3 isoform X1 [Aix galericulata]|nr:Adhesion G protein-coupled receptor G3 isoform X1 [Aix galericulata]